MFKFAPLLGGDSLLYLFGCLFADRDDDLPELELDELEKEREELDEEELEDCLLFFFSLDFYLDYFLFLASYFL